MYIKKNNPTIVIGERLKSHNAFVWDGKLYVEPEKPDEVYRLNFTPKHVEDPHVHVEAKAYRIDFKHISTYTLPETAQGMYLYPYKVEIPHASWLTKYGVGDKINVADDSFSYQRITLTEEIIDAHSYVIFRYALSEH